MDFETREDRDDVAKFLIGQGMKGLEGQIATYGLTLVFADPLTLLSADDRVFDVYVKKHGEVERW